ncbi:MAG TPA: DUF2784 domain-containing protein [Longimicrobium sp.]|nr:DUF2784 domain-containing protein [Longimicrobium sp.]
MSVSPAVYRTLADAVVVFHFGFVLFVVLGGVAVLRWRRAAWVHLPCAAWGALIEFGGWTCPLTPLEKHLRGLGHQAGYAGTFVEQYITRVLYPSGLTRGMQLAIGVFVIAVNVLVYRLAFRRGRRRRPLTPAPAARAR